MAHRNLPPYITHFSHPHPLMLCNPSINPYPPGARIFCDVCGHDVTSPWFYRCAGCRFDVHLHCSPTTARSPAPAQPIHQPAMHMTAPAQPIHQPAMHMPLPAQPMHVRPTTRPQPPITKAGRSNWSIANDAFIRASIGMAVQTAGHAIFPDPHLNHHPDHRHQDDYGYDYDHHHNHYHNDHMNENDYEYDYDYDHHDHYDYHDDHYDDQNENDYHQYD